MRRSGLRTRLARAELRLRPEKQRKPILFAMYNAPDSSIIGIKCIPTANIDRNPGEPINALIARAPAGSLIIMLMYDKQQCGDADG